MTRRRRSTALFAVTAAVVCLAGVAWAAGLAVSSKPLGGATLTTPVLYPTTLTIPTRGTVGRLERNDTITVVYNRVLQNSSLCAGAPQGPSSASGFVFTLTNGGTGNDTLSIGGGTSCPGLHFGSFLLGSTGYTTGTIAYTGSTIAIAPGATTTTITLTIGTGTNATTVNAATVVKYVPDPLITDTTGVAIGTNTATTTASVHF
jgi:hypothetical protein